MKGKVEDYILHHPEIDKETKSSLENFIVVKGMTKEQVRLLLSNPERIQILNSKNKFRTDERWVYIMQGLQAIQIGPVPIYFTHDAYHLYFRGDILTKIEVARMEYL